MKYSYLPKDEPVDHLTLAAVKGLLPSEIDEEISTGMMCNSAFNVCLRSRARVESKSILDGLEEGSGKDLQTVGGRY